MLGKIQFLADHAHNLWFLNVLRWEREGLMTPVFDSRLIGHDPENAEWDGCRRAPFTLIDELVEPAKDAECWLAIVLEGLEQRMAVAPGCLPGVRPTGIHGLFSLWVGFLSSVKATIVSDWRTSKACGRR